MVRRFAGPKGNLDASPLLGICEFDDSDDDAAPPSNTEASNDTDDELGRRLADLPPPHPQQRRPHQQAAAPSEQHASANGYAGSESIKLRVRIMAAGQASSSPACVTNCQPPTNNTRRTGGNNGVVTGHHQVSLVRCSTTSNSNSSTTTANGASCPPMEGGVVAKQRPETQRSQTGSAHSVQVFSPLVRIPSWRRVSSLNEDAGASGANESRESSSNTAPGLYDFPVVISAGCTVEDLAHLVETEYSARCRKRTVGGGKGSESPSHPLLVCGALFKGSEPLLFGGRISDVLAAGDTVTVFNYITCDDDEDDGDSAQREPRAANGREGEESMENFIFVPLSSHQPARVEESEQRQLTAGPAQLPSSIPSSKTAVHHQHRRRISDAVSVATLGSIDMSGVARLVSRAPLKTRFINVLIHPVLLRSFLEFCALPSELALESLLFVLDVERFRHVQPSMARLLANYIYLSYVAPFAPLRVNASSQMRDRIPWPFLPGWDYNPWVFDEILASIGFTLKKHTLLRYERSPVGLVSLMGSPEFRPEEYVTPLRFDMEFDPMVAVAENFEPDIDVIIWVNELKFDPSGTQMLTSLAQLSVGFREQLLERITAQFVDVHRAYCLCDGYFRLLTHIKPLQKQRRIRKTRKIRNFFGDNPHEALLRQQLMAVVPPSSHMPAARAAAELVARKKNTEAKRRAARNHGRQDSVSSSILAEQKILAIDSDSDIEKEHLHGWATQAMKRPPSSRHNQCTRSWSDTDNDDDSDGVLGSGAGVCRKQARRGHFVYNDRALDRALSMIGVSQPDSQDGDSSETDGLTEHIGNKGSPGAAITGYSRFVSAGADAAAAAAASPNYSVQFAGDIRQPSPSASGSHGAGARSLHLSHVIGKRSASVLPNTSSVFERKRRADKLRGFFGRSDADAQGDLESEQWGGTVRSMYSAALPADASDLQGSQSGDAVLTPEQRNLLVRRRRKLKAMLGEQVEDSMIGLAAQPSIAHLRSVQSAVSSDTESDVSASALAKPLDKSAYSLLTPECSSAASSAGTAHAESAGVLLAGAEVADTAGSLSAISDSSSDQSSKEAALRDVQVRQFSKIREVLGESAPAPMLYVAKSRHTDEHGTNPCQASSQSPACSVGSEQFSEEQRMRACWRRNKLVHMLGGVPTAMNTAYCTDVLDSGRISGISESETDEPSDAYPSSQFAGTQGAVSPANSSRNDHRKRVQKLRRFFGQSLNSDAVLMQGISHGISHGTDQHLPAVAEVAESPVQSHTATPIESDMSYEFIPLRSPKLAARNDLPEEHSSSTWRFTFTNAGVGAEKKQQTFAPMLAPDSRDAAQRTEASAQESPSPYAPHAAASTASPSNGWECSPSDHTEKHLDVRITRSSQWLHEVESIIDTPRSCQPLALVDSPARPEPPSLVPPPVPCPLPLILPDLQQESRDGLDELPRPIRAQFWMTSSPESTASIITNEKVGRRTSLLATLRARKASIIGSIKRASPSTSSLSGSIAASRETSAHSAKNSGLSGSILRPRASTHSSQDSQKQPAMAKQPRDKRHSSLSLPPSSVLSPRRNFLSRKINKTSASPASSPSPGSLARGRLWSESRASPRHLPLTVTKEAGGSSIKALSPLPQISPNNFQASFDRGMALREIVAVAEYISSNSPHGSGAFVHGDQLEFPPRGRSVERGTRSGRRDGHQQVISSALLASGGHHSRPRQSHELQRRRRQQQGGSGGGPSGIPKSVHWFDSPSPSASRTNSAVQQRRQNHRDAWYEPMQPSSIQYESLNLPAVAHDHRPPYGCQSTVVTPSPHPAPSHPAPPHHQPHIDEYARAIGNSSCSSLVAGAKTLSEVGMSIVLRSPSTKTSVLVSPLTSPTMLAHSPVGPSRPPLPIYSPSTGPRMALTHKASISAVGGRRVHSAQQASVQGVAALKRVPSSTTSTGGGTNVSYSNIVTIRARRTQSFAVQRRLERATCGRKRSYTIGTGRQAQTGASGAGAADDPDAFPIASKSSRRVQSMIVTPEFPFDVRALRNRCVTVIPLRIELQRLLLKRLASMGKAPVNGQIRIPEGTDIASFSELEDFLNSIPNQGPASRASIEAPAGTNSAPYSPAASSKVARKASDAYSTFTARSRASSGSSFLTAEPFVSPVAADHEPSGCPLSSTEGALARSSSSSGGSGMSGRRETVRRRGSCDMSNRSHLFNSTAAAGIPVQHKLSRSRSCRTLSSSHRGQIPIAAPTQYRLLAHTGGSRVEKLPPRTVSPAKPPSTLASPIPYQRISIALLSRPPPASSAAVDARRSLDTRPVHSFTSPYTAMSLRRYASFGSRTRGHASKE